MPNEEIKQPGWNPWLFFAAGFLALLPVIVGGDLSGGMVAVSLVLGTAFLGHGLNTLRNPVLLTFTPEGIVPRTGGLIPWKEIESLEAVSFGATTSRRHSVKIVMKNPQVYYDSSTRGARAPLAWPVLNRGFAEDVVARAVRYAAKLPA